MPALQQAKAPPHGYLGRLKPAITRGCWPRSAGRQPLRKTCHHRRGMDPRRTASKGKDKTKLGLFPLAALGVRVTSSDKGRRATAEHHRRGMHPRRTASKGKDKAKLGLFPLAALGVRVTSSDKGRRATAEHHRRGMDPRRTASKGKDKAKLGLFPLAALGVRVTSSDKGRKATAEHHRRGMNPRRTASRIRSAAAINCRPTTGQSKGTAGCWELVLVDGMEVGEEGRKVEAGIGGQGKE
jgi:hypothetical protein